MNTAYLVADNIPRDGVTDASDAIQQLIDENPNRTIFFPDGVYRLRKPICTPADPAKSVSLQLASFAVFHPEKNMQRNIHRRVARFNGIIDTVNGLVYKSVYFVEE